MRSLEVQYFILVFVAASGLLQGVFTYRGVTGLQFFSGKIFGYLFCVLLFAGAFVWFFSTSERDAPPMVIEGSQQTFFFLLASTSAVLITYILSSALNRSRMPGAWPSKLEPGLDEMRHGTFAGRLPFVGKSICNMLSRLVGQGR